MCKTFGTDSFKHLVNVFGVDRFVPCVVKKNKERNPWISLGHVTSQKAVKKIKQALLYWEYHWCKEKNS